MIHCGVKLLCLAADNTLLLSGRLIIQKDARSANRQRHTLGGRRSTRVYDINGVVRLAGHLALAT